MMQFSGANRAEEAKLLEAVTAQGEMEAMLDAAEIEADAAKSTGLMSGAATLTPAAIKGGALMSAAPAGGAAATTALAPGLAGPVAAGAGMTNPIGWAALAAMAMGMFM